jgi:hypothetical protein
MQRPSNWGSHAVFIGESPQNGTIKIKTAIGLTIAIPEKFFVNLGCVLKINIIVKNIF